MKHLFHFLCLFFACQTLFGQSHNSFDLALSICKKDKILLIPNTASSVFFENGSCGSMGPVPVATYNHFVRFKIKSSGTLVFIIIPTNPNDDLDFQLFQVVPTSPGKITRRCMAAGGISAVDPCMGATGLNYGQTDTTAAPGCSNTFDNFLAPIYVQAGEEFVLGISNFSSRGSFSLEFCGDAMLECDIEKCDKTLVSSKELKTQEGTVKVFPNPVAVGQSLLVEGEMLKHIMIFDQSGVLLYKNDDLPSGSSSLSIDAQDFKAGCYLIRIVTNDGVITRKFVVQSY